MQKKQNHSKVQKSKNDNQLLLEYCKDINDWPDSWEIDSDDIRVGNHILEHFTAFLIDKIQQGRAKKTIKNYAQYLWILGSELISRINFYEHERELSAKELILNYIDQDGGPLWQDASSELEQDRYDSVCKALFKFMTQIH
jgi:hypothetical protein